MRKLFFSFVSMFTKLYSKFLEHVSTLREIDPLLFVLVLLKECLDTYITTI